MQLFPKKNLVKCQTVKTPIRLLLDLGLHCLRLHIPSCQTKAGRYSGEVIISRSCFTILGRYLAFSYKVETYIFTSSVFLYSKTSFSGGRQNDVERIASPESESIPLNAFGYYRWIWYHITLWICRIQRAHFEVKNKWGLPFRIVFSCAWPNSFLLK